MPMTQSGIEYKQVFALSGGRNGYKESFTKDANSFSQIVVCKWSDAEDFRRDVLGHTEYDSSYTKSFRRTLPMLCPYTTSAYAYKMDLIDYGRMPSLQDFGTDDFDAAALAANAANGISTGQAIPAFYENVEMDDWMETAHAMYEIQFARLPYPIVTDDMVINAQQGGDPLNNVDGCELDRYVIRRRVNNVRELRTPDYNFQIVGTTTPILVNSFVAAVESELIYTLVQVPYDHVPRAAVDSCRLKINNSTFDAGRVFYPDGTIASRPGYPPATLLFVDCRGIDLPPAMGADGGLYQDLDFIFRHKQNHDPDGNIVGHQHFLNANGEWTLVERRAPAPASTYLYEQTDDFVKLFTPEA